jgi:methylated-DNA-protein-cysteine methyltransferase related protein
VSPERGADRRAEIVRRVRSIPSGQVRTYGEISPSAPRLAGRVLATLGATERAPWWRVVRADGSLAVGEHQRRRLEAEGVPVDPGPPPRVDFRALEDAAG